MLHDSHFPFQQESNAVQGDLRLRGKDRAPIILRFWKLEAMYRNITQMNLAWRELLDEFALKFQKL